MSEHRRLVVSILASTFDFVRMQVILGFLVFLYVLTSAYPLQGAMIYTSD
jgi:hypothetical protein